MNLNKVFILGRVTADLQLRTTAGGQSVATFSIATNRNWTDKGGQKQEETEFHNVVAWGRQAEIANQFLRRGSLVLIEGRLQTRSWQDKQGQARKSTEIIIEQLQLGPRSTNPGGTGGEGGGAWSGASKPASSGAADSPSQPAAEEEIPIINMDEEDSASFGEVPF
jgi:single-strand DNA-binding protein